jgi:hypothetical protein
MPDRLHPGLRAGYLGLPDLILGSAILTGRSGLRRATGPVIPPAELPERDLSSGALHRQGERPHQLRAFAVIGRRKVLDAPLRIDLFHAAPVPCLIALVDADGKAASPCGKRNTAISLLPSPA